MKYVHLVPLLFLVILALVTGCIGLFTQVTAGETANAFAVVSAPAPAALEGNWTLVAIEPHDSPRVAVPESAITLTAGSSRRLTGTIDCNIYFSGYLTGEETPGRDMIAVMGYYVTDNACPENSDPGDRYRQVLTNVSAYSGDGTYLNLTTDKGDVLAYKKGITRLADPYPVATMTTAPEPVEMAYLEDTLCAVVDEKVTTYRCLGKVRIKSGVYDEVQVIVKYPDNNRFESQVSAMGGSNPVLKSFYIFPDMKYENIRPEWFIRLDDTEYPVIRSGNSGTAYINPPPTQETIPFRQYVTNVVTLTPTTKKTTVPPASGPARSNPPVTSISPSTGPAGLRQYTITGSGFRQYPPSEVYFRKAGSACEYCGIHATQVQYLTPETLSCSVSMDGPDGGPGTYDVLVTNTYLADSYGELKNGLVIV